MIYAALRAHATDGEEQEERVWGEWAATNAATAWGDLD